MIVPGKRGEVIMLESIINLLSSGSVESHTPQPAPQCCVRRWLDCLAECVPGGANAYPAYRLSQLVGPVSGSATGQRH